MRVVPGPELGYLSCPFCGKDSEFLIGYSEAHIICSDHNCLGKMSVHWGTHDEPYRFIEKMKSNWNKRTRDGYAIVAAKEYLEKFVDITYQESQKEYSDCCANCVEIAKDFVDKLILFIP